MSLIIASGSNLGDSVAHLKKALDQLSLEYQLVAASRIYTSAAVDYEAQPNFYNQVLEFQLPKISPESVMQKLLEIETTMGRQRVGWRGPRTIDLDIIFWGITTINSEHLTVPHPRWQERSFVVRPLMELPFFQTIEKCFTIPQTFKIDASPIS
ncbi:MAG TPA: 2-amino-4-hydroxy-6-hydroxymethyldihydropteridine diphosphokinase [Bacteriovoracaceae bacterium]|nr:2-amino-4-hydroxy-6-hydroxymethyldihydropteridine diphosphokinase [Bacteriovoracaceae bacterium]